MNLNEDQIKLLDSVYRDASKGLLTAPALISFKNLLETTWAHRVHHQKYKRIP